MRVMAEGRCWTVRRIGRVEAGLGLSRLDSAGGLNGYDATTKSMERTRHDVRFMVGEAIIARHVQLWCFGLRFALPIASRIA